MTTTWNYSSFNVYKTYNSYNNIVYSYRYTVTVTDGSNSATTTGLVRLNFDNITNYIPFESLTQQTVQQWTEQTIDTAKIIKNLTESVLAKGSDVETNLPAPWNPPSAP